MKGLVQRFSNSSLPLALKWSLLIACLVFLVMGLLGWFLINQQAESYRGQSGVFGRMMADQLALAAGEPLMADDDLALKVLVGQQEKSEWVVGMQIYDRRGRLRSSAGLAPIGDILGQVERSGGTAFLPWRTPYIDATSFISEIRFREVAAGYAVVSLDQAPLERQLLNLKQMLISSTLGLTLLGVLLAFPLAHRMSRPIRELAEAGETMGSGQSHHAISAARKDEIGRVFHSFQHMAAGIEKKREVEQAFARYLSPPIARQVLGQPGAKRLGGRTLVGSVLFCDVVGFTEISEQLAPKQVGELLNDYFSYFSIAADSCGGTVDKFIGDCIMVLFGVPERDDAHGLHAVTCGVLFQAIAERINSRRRDLGEPLVMFRIGINTGPMLAGNLGSAERMQYTVVGDSVNLASRLCNLAAPGEVLITRETLEEPEVGSLVRVSQKPRVKVKGRTQQVIPFRVDAESFLAETTFQQSLQRIMPGETMA